MAPDREEVLKNIDQSRRRFLRTVIAGAAFAPPVVMSFSMNGLSVDPADADCPGPSLSPGTSSSPTPPRGSNMTTQVPVVFYLDRGTGGNLLLTENAPTATTAKFTDSPALSRSNGNPWKPIGAWDAISNLHSSCPIEELSDLHVWLGLRNSDDQGARFDLRADFSVDGTVIATGETDGIIGLVRNPAQAKEVIVTFGPADMVELTGALSLVLSARIAANSPHASATGLRLYYGSATQDSNFDVDFQ